MSIKWYVATELNGGDDSALDMVPNPGNYTELFTGDKCFVLINNLYTRIYEYDETLADAEDFFNTIVIPADNSSGTGAWKEKRMTGILSFWAGTIANTFDALVTEAGGVVSLDFEGRGSIPGLGIWSDDLIQIPIQSIVLDHGTDEAPTANYVYILRADPTVLVTDTEWPAVEHIKVAYLLIPSAAEVAAEGAYINQNWNDGNEPTGQGHLSAIGENIRLTADGAHWNSGCAGNGLTDGYITIVTGDTPDSAYFLTTAGICYQMHRHTVPAYNSQTQEMHVVNAFGEPYKKLNDIRDEEVDALNGNLVNRYYNIVFWQVANKGGEYAPIMMNMPTGTYVGLDSAINDVDGYDVYDIPREFKEESATGFLLCRITFRQTASAITVHNTTDLRGRTPGTASGTSIGGDSEFADNQFKLFNVLDSTKIVDLDLSGIDTGNTRTITPADADMKILSATDHDDLTDGGDTTLHDHDGISENTGARHAESHDIASHSDTTATGSELEDLTDGGETTLHYHSALKDGGELGVIYTNGATAVLNFAGAPKLQTSNTGATVIGTLVADGLTLGEFEPVTLGGGGLIYGHTTGVDTVEISDTTGIKIFAKFKEDGPVELYYNANKKLETTNTGATITGTLVADGLTLSGTEFIQFDDGRINSNGTDLVITNSTGSENMAKFIENGAVNLFYNNSKKFNTQASGCKITGALAVDGIYLGDGEYIRFGDGPDARVRSNGSALVIFNGAGTETMAKFIPNGAVQLYHNNVNMLETTATGIRLATGTAIIQNNSYESAIHFADNGATALYYDNAVTMQTKADGIFTYSTGTGTTYAMVHRNSAAFATTNYSGYAIQMATSTTADQNSMLLLTRFMDTTHATRSSQIVLQGLYNGSVQNVWNYAAGVFYLYHGGAAVTQTTSIGLILIPGGAATKMITGPNSPEGVHVGAIGSIYMATNGGAGTTFYVKESGTGDTGWVAK